MKRSMPESGAGASGWMSRWIKTGAASSTFASLSPGWLWRRVGFHEHLPNLVVHRQDRVDLVWLDDREYETAIDHHVLANRHVGRYGEADGRPHAAVQLDLSRLCVRFEHFR